jgi:hypothetical protein
MLDQYFPCFVRERLIRDLIVFHLYDSNKANQVSAKFLLKWSRPVVIAKIVRPNVVLLANPETGVIIRKAHVSQ